MKRKPQAVAGDDNSSGANSNANEENVEDPNNKRPKAGVPKETASDGEVAESLTKAPISQPAPKYGTKEYWEARYKSHKSGVGLVAENANEANEPSENTSNADSKSNESSEANPSYVVDGVVLTKEATKPGHEWYFSYDELRPLILPLILGNMDDDNESQEDCEEYLLEDGEDNGDGWVEVEEDQGDDGNDGEDTCEDGNGESDDDGESTKCDNEIAKTDNVGEQPRSTNNRKEPEDDEEASCQNDSLAGEPDAPRPKRVLEVGCGDAPIGTSLVSDLTSVPSDLTSDTPGFGALCVVEEVTCIDYSEIVIEGLIEKYKMEQESKQGATTENGKQKQNDSQLHPTFKALDARSLPYESNTYDLIIDKGTLDAMLSDEDEGVKNCIQIVKEMARVTSSEGGAILIVSHLNANEKKGMGWLEDVVFRGLKDEFLERQKFTKEKQKAKKDEASAEEGEEENEYVWSVEVHGGDGKFLDANGDEIEQDKVPDDAVPIYGPAVYILRKKSVPASIARELFGKKKKNEGTGVGGEDNATEEMGTEQDRDGSDDEDELMEMPPVKLEFLTYD